MANIAGPGGRPEVQFNYWGLAQSAVTTAALMALSIVAMRAIERYGKKTLTPLQKQGLGIVATTIYFTAATYIFPLSKQVPPNPSLPESKPPAPQPKQISLLELPEMEVAFYLEMLERVRASEVQLISREFEISGKTVILRIPLNDDGERQQAISYFEGKLPRVEEPVLTRQRNSSESTEVSTQSSTQNEDVTVTTGAMVPLRRNSRDCSSMDPRFILSEIHYLRGLILQNDFQSVTQTIPWDGKVFAIHFDISTPQRQQKVLALLNQVSGQIIDPLALPPSSKSQVTDLTASYILRSEDYVVVQPYKATYVEANHGVNGSFMRERYFETLLGTFKSSIEAKGIPVEGRYQILQERYSICLSYEDSYLKTMYGALVDHDRPAETRYIELLRAHRKLLALPQFTGDTQYVSDAFIVAVKTAKVHRFQHHYVGEFLGAHGRVLTLENFASEFKERNQAVKDAPSAMKMHSGLVLNGGTRTRQLCGAINWENYYEVNPVNHLETITLQKGELVRTIDYIRGPTPHLSGANIDPTFKVYLQILDGEGKSFLYCAHQRLKDQKSGMGYWTQFEIEDHRSQTLIALEQDHPNFLLIFQSVENGLVDKRSIGVSDLKAKIKLSFTHPDGRNQNRLPLRLQADKTYVQRMDVLLDLVEETFFKKVTNLSRKERESFVFYFYALQRLDLMTGDYLEGKPVAAMTTPCKDFYDRGLGQALMTRISNLVLIYGKDIPAEKLEEIANAGQFPPLLGKGLPAIPHRFEPACDAIEHLARVDIEPLRRFNFNGYTVTKTTVHHQEGQSAVPVIEGH